MDTEWRRGAAQLKNKLKNTWADYYKTVKGNAGTGEIRRTMNADSILIKLVPAESPMISITTKIDSTANSDRIPMTSAKLKKVDPVDQAIINLVAPKTKTDMEMQIEEKKAKVELFKSFEGRKPEEFKEVLEIIKTFNFK